MLSFLPAAFQRRFGFATGKSPALMGGLTASGLGAENLKRKFFP
jgi:hypothetical protein